MKPRLALILGLLLVTLFFLGCQKTDSKELAINKCKELCLKAKQEIQLDSQCLSDLYEGQWQVNDWVCDIAHWPRQQVDDLPENQCQSYRQGKAKHFVELDESCSFIRAL